jgi:hypothetical protein
MGRQYQEGEIAMTKKSHRGRPLCKDQACDVEVAPERKYCDAHQWRIVTWLETSQKQLANAIRRQAQEVK